MYFRLIEEFHFWCSLQKQGGKVALSPRSVFGYAQGGLFSGLGGGVCGHNVHNRPVFLGTGELYGAIRHGENGVVFAQANVFAGDEFGAALTHDDVTAQNFFAAVTLDAKTLTG
jgi:hypothetical protein